MQVLQAWKTYVAKCTGQLSLLSYLMMLAGTLARIYTSIQETGDTMVVLIYVTAAACNTLLVAQLVYYPTEPSGVSGASERAGGEGGKGAGNGAEKRKKPLKAD